MPLYEFTCKACGHKDEVLRRVDHRDDIFECTGCGSTLTERTIWNRTSFEFAAFKNGQAIRIDE